MHPEFEAVIGLEVHCQLATDTKIFCGCPVRLPGRLYDGKSVADIEPNINTCPICAGHPGTLPVLNQKVVEYAILAGLATNCKINPRNVFARKNYFYPDLPKGYQISQYESPICEMGWLDIEVGQADQMAIKRIGIGRIHMEEDAGKSIHKSGYSLVNLNRAGVPLIEIVSNPDMRSSQEAGAYLRNLYAIVTFLGICDGNMQEGNFRCDANVSVMPKGSQTFGTRAEIKNVNSFKFVEKAIDYEIRRQIEVIQSGGKIIQETRTYDSDRDVTLSMRSKEEAQDYRYFPDPDLIPLRLEATWIDQLKSELPELPAQKRDRFIREFGLTSYDANALTSSKALAAFFEKVLEVKDLKGLAKQVANWIAGEITRLLNEDHIEIDKSRLQPSHLADLVRMVHQKIISNTGAKQVLAIVWKTGEAVSVVVEKEGLKQMSDVGDLDPVINKIMVTFPAQVAEYRAGKEKVIGFLVGQAMKETGGKANPALLGDLLKKKLKV